MAGRSREGQTKVTRRGLGAVVVAALGAVTTATLPALAATSYRFVVPNGVTRIRVRSYRDGDQVIDTELNVTPGQTFRIDPVKE